jgi:hypothetical protein
MLAAEEPGQTNVPPTAPDVRSANHGASRFFVVSRVRIELTTRGFSIHCSTD